MYVMDGIALWAADHMPLFVDGSRRAVRNGGTKGGRKMVANPASVRGE